MTDKSGDDKQVIFAGDHYVLREIYERTVAKVAMGNLYIQKDIEVARAEHAELVELFKSIEERLEQEKKAPAPKQSSPPGMAAFLLACIAPTNSAQSLLGDLEEMFGKNVDKFGEDQARRMYWFEAARSVGPIIWRWVKRMGFITFLVDYVRSKFGF